MGREVRRLAVAFATLVAVVLVGCGSSSNDGDSSDASAAALAATDVAVGWPGVHDASPAESADEAPSGPDLGLLGQGSLEGQDVVIWFWAEW